MNSSAVGRMMPAGKLPVRFVKAAPCVVVPNRFVLSATKYRNCDRGSSTIPVGISPPAVVYAGIATSEPAGGGGLCPTPGPAPQTKKVALWRRGVAVYLACCL